MNTPAELLGASTYAAIMRNRGADAQQWVDELPKLVFDSQRRYALRLEAPFTDGRSSCVLAVRCADGRAGVLKLAPPWHGIERELHALRVWRGLAAPALIASDIARGLLLMERVAPGDTVSELDAGALAELSSRMHRPAPHAPHPGFPSVAQEVARRLASREVALSRMTAGGAYIQLDRLALADARRWAQLLAHSEREQVLCHGDFYAAKNVLRCERRGPVVIDPFACVGEREYDFALWANTAASFATEPLNAIAKLAEHLALDQRRLLAYAALLAGAQLCGTSDERRPRREQLWRTLHAAARSAW